MKVKRRGKCTREWVFRKKPEKPPLSAGISFFPGKKEKSRKRLIQKAPVAAGLLVICKEKLLLHSLAAAVTERAVRAVLAALW